MDALSPALRPSLSPALHVGLRVEYHERGMPTRAAVVGNVREDGRTCDLVVFCDGNDPLQWALGNGVVRSRTVIPFHEDDPASTRHWNFAPEQDARAGLSVGLCVRYSENGEPERPAVVGSIRTGRIVDLVVLGVGRPEHRACCAP